MTPPPAPAAHTPWHLNDETGHRADDKHGFSITNGDARIIANVVTYHLTHGIEGGKANGELIVRAVNNHAALLAALEAALAELVSSRVFVTSRERVKRPEGEDLYDETIEKCRTAIRAARGEG